MRKLFVLLVLIPNFAMAEALETIKEHTKSTVTDAFDSTGIWILGIGSLTTIIAHQFDQQVREGAKDHQSMSPSLSKVGEFWGSGIPEVATLGTQYFFDQNKAIAGFEGLILGSLVVQGFKYTVHRERPDGSEDVSFPSGHTQASFSLATSMTESYGWKKALPFWAMAVLTGASRIADDKHWLSDVTAGATIGILFGRAGFKHHSVTPAVHIENERLVGLALSFQYEF